MGAVGGRFDNHIGFTPNQQAADALPDAIPYSIVEAAGRSDFDQLRPNPLPLINRSLPRQHANWFTGQESVTYSLGGDVKAIGIEVGNEHRAELGIGTQSVNMYTISW